MKDMFASVVAWLGWGILAAILIIILGEDNENE